MTSLSPAPTEPFPRTNGGVLLRPDLWPVLSRAVAELALARWLVGRRHVRDMMGSTHPDLPLYRFAPPKRADVFAARVAWAIPRMARLVPWRSDCLVQATAAQRWLGQKGVPTHLHIGVRKDRTIGFEAHAWLCHGAKIVTGGDVSGFVPMVQAPDQSL
jgi:hypothetical protein